MVQDKVLAQTENEAFLSTDIPAKYSQQHHDGVYSAQCGHPDDT